MAGIKDAFSKGLTTINVKTNNFMEETKVKTYISTMENESKNLCTTVGRKIFEQWQDGTVDINSVTEELQELTRLQKEIEKSQEKIQELQKTEEAILGKRPAETAAGAVQGDIPEGERIFCSQCGGVNSTAYKFCCKCGAPLAR